MTVKFAAFGGNLSRKHRKLCNVCGLVLCWAGSESKF